MEAAIELLTTSEAAVAAGVSIPQIHRMIDEKILPEDLYSANQMRTFQTAACVLIAFYFETADSLTAQARLRTIRNAIAHCSRWEDLRHCVIRERSITVRLSDIWNEVNGRLAELKKARTMVVEDPEILSGTPVIRGTRVPVYDVAAAAQSGTPIDKILASYPSLNAGLVELALLYAKAVPPRGRPRRMLHPHAARVSVSKIRLRRPSGGGGTRAEVPGR